MKNKEKAGEAFARLVWILDTLRGPEGCPWDKEQDERSISDYFLEEVYEAVEAILSGETSSVSEELGDVMMEIVFLSRIFEEKDKFSIMDVIEGINTKMVRRHPHVFDKQQADNAEEVLGEWNRRKKKEKERKSLLDGLVRLNPALLSAFQIGQRVSVVGFDWDGAVSALQKVKEEILEFERSLTSKKDKEAAEELGDVFFALVNVSRHLRVNPEVALRMANKKFITRFQQLEDRLRDEGRDPAQVSLKEMDEIWEEIKKIPSS